MSDDVIEAILSPDKSNWRKYKNVHVLDEAIACLEYKCVQILNWPPKPDHNISHPIKKNKQKLKLQETNYTFP